MISNIMLKRRALIIGIFALSFVAFFSACDDDENENPRYLWAPLVKIQKGDGEATLLLIDPRPFSLYTAPGPVSPTHFKIMISEDLQNFSELQTVNAETTSVVISDLDNEKAYYFFVTSHKNNFRSETTDTVMTIPSRAFQRDNYTNTPGGTFERLLTSFDQRYTAFRVNDKYYQYETASPETVHLVDNDSYSASWSPNSNRLVYVKDTRVGFISYPSSLNIYDPETESSSLIMTIPYQNYLAGYPSFTPDGNMITFLSSENNSQDYIYDLWSIAPITWERVKLSNFEALGFITNSKFEWAASGQEIYLDGAYGFNDTDIYKFNIATKQLTPIVVSEWRDERPSISPDNHNVAFISDRSGEDELWIYNLTNSEYKQITGETGYNFDSRFTELQWLDNDRIFISVFDEESTVAITINVNQ